MSGKNKNFNDKKVNKSSFYRNKKPFNIYDIVNKILISKKESYGNKSSFKYFIWYNDNNNIIPLCIKLPQIIGYVTYFDSNKTVSFNVIDNKLLKSILKNGKVLAV